MTSGPGVRHAVAMAEHAGRRHRLLEAFERLAAPEEGAPRAPGHIGLDRRRTHTFRPRARPARRLDLGAFTHVLGIEVEERRAFVEGGVTFEALVEATLPVGLMPAVVPELATITVGGAVAGVGIEATSFREGLVHDTIEEMDVLVGTGSILTCSSRAHRDLFRGLPNSYGTLGYALRLTVRLAPVRRLVTVDHIRTSDVNAFVEAMVAACEGAVSAGGGGGPDFVDGVVFSPDEQYLNVGRFADEGPEPSDYTGAAIYYRSIRERPRDTLTTRDYIWRWDTDWFWCSRHFGMENPILRRLAPRALRGSRGYGAIRRWAERLGLSPGPGQESVVQDIGFEPAAAARFLAWFLAEIPIRPIWVCPFTPRRVAPLFPVTPRRLHLDVAFWDSVRAGRSPGETNRRIEAKTADLGGIKSLYARSYYDRASFERAYGGDAWRILKDRYDPDGVLGELYSKCVEGG